MYNRHVIVDLNDLTEALARLALEGGDCLEIEAKTFSEYSRSALGPTLSAFANLPGGGTVLLGVSEDPVSVVGVQDPHKLRQALVSQARQGFSTEIAVDTHAIIVEGKTVIAANVQEAPVNSKPCRWKETGAAYLRQYDGDYRMSQQEEQQLLLRHQRPRQDSVAVPGTSVDSLDNDLVQRFLRAVRTGSTALSGQPDAEVLVNLNVLTEDGETTRAGLYALGRYPQRQFPGLSITAAVTGTNAESGQQIDSRSRAPCRRCSPMPSTGSHAPRRHASSSGMTGTAAMSTSSHSSRFASSSPTLSSIETSPSPRSRKGLRSVCCTTVSSPPAQVVSGG